ncbi:MAG: hypothetical protein KDB63_11960 [Nocardioidaceae bacterium]|nr:hypothetical protein [Nocardioidaceae bacterium]
MDQALRPALMALSIPQVGLFTRQQALGSGYSADEIRGCLRPRGPWRVVRRGVYLLRASWDAADDHERSRWRDIAAHLDMATPHLLSHDSAARALAVPLVAARSQLIHVTRPGVGGSRTRHGVKHHLGRELPADVVRRDGMAMTGLARTALDLAREHGFASGVAAIDNVLHRGVSRRAFELELARMTSWPHVRRARSAFGFGDARAESPGESLTRILLAELGFSDIDLQFPVPVAGGVRWCDLRVGCHVIEFDGKVKYLPPEHGGVATTDPAEVAWLDRQRDTDIATLGLGISHVTWVDLFSRREATLVRLRREEAATRRRFGCRLPEELARFAAANPRRRTPGELPPNWCGAMGG